MTTAAVAGEDPMTSVRSGLVGVLAGGRDRVAFAATVREHGPPLLALSGLAITQPLLDLFGANPEFFVASDMTRSEIVAFGLLAAFLVPSVLMAVVLVGRAIGGSRAAAAVARSLLGVLAFAFGLTVSRQLDIERTVACVAVAAPIAVLIVALIVRSSGVRQAVRYLSLAPLAFLALFLFASESSALLFEDQAAAATDVTIGRPAPIVVVLLDEVPVASLMRADGSLNEERFPNFARLAEASTWYRDATSVSPNTPNSVPTILDGDFPPAGALPTSTDHPENLFTLFGDTYDLDVTETVTELCPSALCVTDIGHSLGDFFDRLGQALSDASVVYGHASLPRRFREDLPAVNQSWGGFIDDAGPDALSATASATDDEPVRIGETPVEFLQRQVRERAGQNPDLDGETLRTAIADSSVNDDEDLLFIHEVFPHFPWVRTPTGGIYENRPGPPGTTDGTWGDNEFLVTQAQQRHLLQLGYADVAIGELIDKLEADGVWDDALVVLTADHGISFSVGQPSRSPTDLNVHEVYNVPLFIKAPGGQGRIDDEPARTIDILPTIVDLLDVTTDFTFDGRSLVGDDRATDQPVVFGGGPDEVVGGIDEIVRIAARNAERYPQGDGWDAVVATGPYGALVGREVADLDAAAVDGVRWTVDQADQLASIDLGTGVVPLILTGDLSPSGPRPDGYVVAVNGVVAGVVGFEVDDGAGRWSALLDETAFVDGSNEVQLLTVSGPPSAPIVGTAGSPR